MKIVAAEYKAVGGNTPRGFRSSRAHTLFEGPWRQQMECAPIHRHISDGDLRIEAVRPNYVWYLVTDCHPR